MEVLQPGLDDAELSKLFNRTRYYREWFDGGSKPTKAGYICILEDLERAVAELKRLQLLPPNPEPETDR